MIIRDRPSAWQLFFILRRFSAEVARAATEGRLRMHPLDTVALPYTLMLHRKAYLYCLMLPFGLVDSIGFTTPLVVGLISYTFFGLDARGDEIEEPFGTLPNDLPLDSMCRRVEIDLRAALGERDLPAMPKPVDYCLM
jgi:putative membrane protein